MIIRRTRCRVCACGCGTPVGLRTDGKPKKYVHGHNAYGMSRTKLYVVRGQRFGFLTVVKQLGGDTNLVSCVCDCGEGSEVTAHRLLTGHTRSCGRCQSSASQIRHGLNRKGRRHRLYGIWANMKSRCNNPNVPAFKDYGGRGIFVCDRWHTFENFYADMHPSYVQGLTLERKDNDQGYSPGNCKWADWVEQANNRRKPAPRRKL